MSEIDPMDEFRKYIVVCGKAHVSVNDMYRYTKEEADVIRTNMENKLMDKLETLEKGDNESRKTIEWKLATLEVKEIVIN